MMDMYTTAEEDAGMEYLNQRCEIIDLNTENKRLRLALEKIVAIEMLSPSMDRFGYLQEAQDIATTSLSSIDTPETTKGDKV